MKEKRPTWADWTALGAIILLTIFYGWTLADVPFHPDESTQIYMSADLSTLLRNPLALSWDGSSTLDGEERIRAIDAPLAKYLIGAARAALSVPPLESDWDWAASWEENAADGALPSPRQLLISRAAITALLPLALGLYYLSLRENLPGIPALLGVLLLGLNPLVLLHGRRAMSEGVLIFGLAFFLWAATRAKRDPWLIGLALAVALNAKHTAVALLPAGLYAACLIPGGKISLKKITSRILKFSLPILVVSALLNPFYWRQPLQAFQTGLDARFRLARQQEIDHFGGPEQDRLSFLQQRVIALIANTFYMDPQTEEVGNYLAETRQSRESYLSKPIHTWGRGLIGGAISLALVLSGAVLTLRKIREQPRRQRENILVWLLSSLGLVLILLLPLPWQRYVVPLLPLSVYWLLSLLDPPLRALKGKFNM